MTDATALVELIRGLRATRSFGTRPVGDELVDAVLDAARWTGSARNRQPWRVAVVRDPRRRADLARLGAYAHHLAGAPVVLVVGADLSSGADAEFDVGRFCQSAMLAASALGLGSCPATFFPTGNVDAAARIAGLDRPWVTRTAIGLGHPAPSPFPPGTRSVIPTGRLDLDVIRRPAPDGPVG